MNRSTSSLNSCIEMSTINSSTASLEEAEKSTVSDNKLRALIWGPFYYLAQSTGLILHISPEEIKTIKGLLHLIPNITITLILLANVIYCFVRMSNVSFSINWAYSNALLFLSIHGAVSSLVMMGFKYNNYISTVITMLRKATKNDFHIPSKLTFRKVLGLICFVVMMASMIMYSVENYLLYPITVTLPESFNVSSNDTQFFRKSMFGYQPLFFLDTIIKVYSMLVSVSCLFLYLRANGATCVEFDHFNKELKNKISDKSILKLEVIEAVESQLTDFLILMKFITESCVGVISISCIAGIILYTCSYYAHRAFTDYLLYGNITHFLWSAVAIILLVSSCLRAGAFYVLVRETNDILHLSHEIQKEAPNERFRQIVRDMIMRINDTDYGAKNMFPIQFGMILFHIFMLAIPFIMEFFVKDRYVPEFLIEVIAHK